MRAAQFLAIIGRGSKGSNALENTEDRAGATSEQQDNVINTVNSLDPYGPSWQLVPGNVAAGTVYAQVPTSGTGDLTFTRASTATRTNSAGNIVDVASGVGRIHYRNADGSLSSTGRLLLEPQRTNSIRNSTMVGAVAGTPGTLPTNWGIVNSLTQTIVAIGTENGLQYMDVRFNGTSGGTTILLNLESSSQIAASNGQMWTNSFYFKSIAAPTPPNSYNLLTIQRLSGVAGASFTQPFTPTSTLARYTQTVTTNNPSITHIQPYLSIGLTSGATYDFTIRIAAPQMELGAYATTFIPTTTAAVTRLADTASKTGVSDLIGQTEGTMFAEVNWGLKAEPGSPVCGILTLNTNVANIQNSIILGIERAPAGTNRVYCFGIVSNVVQFELFSSNIANGNYKIAIGYKQNDFVLYVNGAQIGTDTSGTVPATSQIILGNKFNGDTRVMSDGITQAALFKTRLTNAQLAEITTL